MTNQDLSIYLKQKKLDALIASAIKAKKNPAPLIILRQKLFKADMSTNSGQQQFLDRIGECEKKIAEIQAILEEVDLL